MERISRELIRRGTPGRTELDKLLEPEKPTNEVQLGVTSYCFCFITAASLLMGSRIRER